MKEPGKATQDGLPAGHPLPVRAGKATKLDVPPRPPGLLFLIAVLKKRCEPGAPEDER